VWRGSQRGFNLKLDYHKPPKRVGQKSVWIGVALWIVIALFLTAVVYGLYANRANPAGWR
jgi:hypothetical protein